MAYKQECYNLLALLRHCVTCSINPSISTGQFLNVWKLGRITPIPIGSYKTLPSGYRPILIFSLVSKPIPLSIMWRQFLKPIYRWKHQSLQWGRSSADICLKLWDSNYDELFCTANLPSLQQRCIQLSLPSFTIVNGLIDFPLIVK